MLDVLKVRKMDMALMNKIGEILRREDTVLFIGSGLSQWSGLPSWFGIIDELANFLEQEGLSAEAVRKEAQDNHLLQAASYGVHQMTKQQFSSFIRKTCRIGKALPHEIHNKVVNLGPRSFITTNYDHLIEDALRQHRSELVFQVVTNRHLTETANIVQAKAKDFIFKPHGDVDDSESIILTREQYRVLYGDKIHVLRALETLLVSRPIVYIGFGLKDPDFLYIKDILNIIYKGGTCDHYAITPEVSNQEKRYWRQEFGIHVLSYDTLITSENKKDHSKLVEIIDYLLKKDEREAITEPIYFDESQRELSDGQILSLVRYVSGISRQQFMESKKHLPLTVTLSEKQFRKKDFTYFYQYHNSNVEKFLSTMQGKVVLIGNPGAGKTYSLKRFCSKQAEKVREFCLANKDNIIKIHIPIYVDLKLYNGDLWNMANSSLPSQLDLNFLVKAQVVVFVLDSFNEMPREYFDNDKYEDDFNKFYKRIGGNRLIIASRTDEGLEKYNYPIFRIAEIEQEYIEEVLRIKGHIIDGMFKEEVINLLQKPLFFRLYYEEKVDIQYESHPRSIYKSLFHKLSNEISIELNQEIDIVELLKSIAFYAIDEGQEAISLSQFEYYLKNKLDRLKIINTDANTLINLLISHNILIPLPGTRLTFFHQSVTEYLAAMELARYYKATPEILEKCLRHTRWDQALFLTLGFLSQDESQDFMDQVLKTDLLLCVKAAKYVEFNQEIIVSNILNAIISVKEQYDYMWWQILELPVSQNHKPQLKQLVSYGNSLGGMAGVLLTQACGSEAKAELIDEMFSRSEDFNFCYNVCNAISPFIEKEDMEKIFLRLNDYTGKKNIDGLITACSHIVSEHSEFVELFLPWQNLNEIQLKVLISSLYDIKNEKKNEKAEFICVEMVRNRISDAIFSLNMLCGDDFKNLELFNEDIVEVLISFLNNNERGQWAVSILKFICLKRPDLAEIVTEAALKSKGVFRLVLLYCNSFRQPEMFWNYIKELANSDLTAFSNEPFYLFKHLKIEWMGNFPILLKLLEKDNFDLIYGLLDSIVLRRTFSIDFPLPKKLILELLDKWTIDEVRKMHFKDHLFYERLGEFLAQYTTSDIQLLLVELFNDSNSPYRFFLLNSVIGRLPDLTTNQLTEDAINYIMSDLFRRRSNWFSPNPIGRIATESFVQEKLLTLLSRTEEPLRTNLRYVLLDAGNKHRKRYLMVADL